MIRYLVGRRDIPQGEDRDAEVTSYTKQGNSFCRNLLANGEVMASKGAPGWQKDYELLTTNEVRHGPSLDVNVSRAYGMRGMQVVCDS